jgi:outer membrane biosynthesis protein TonB
MPKKKPAKKPAPAKKAAKKSAAKTAAKRPARPKKISLGRPTVTAEEKLFMLFHGDYEARQVFEFLRAETVGELEQFSPQEIIHKLSRPIRETVDRIRNTLADRNRCLAGDEAYAAARKTH